MFSVFQGIYNTGRLISESKHFRPLAFSKVDYSEVSNKRGVFLILFEKKFPTTCLIHGGLYALLEPPRLIISGKPATNTVFM